MTTMKTTVQTTVSKPYNAYVHQCIDNAMQATAESDLEIDLCSLVVHEVSITTENFSGELINYLTIDIQYNPCGWRALYGFKPESVIPVLWAS